VIARRTSGLSRRLNGVASHSSRIAASRVCIDARLDILYLFLISEACNFSDVGTQRGGQAPLRGNSPHFAASRASVEIVLRRL
jgi:hypothetical protein